MKYFVLSDIHSFYNEMIESLDQAGYDKKNKDHILIVCGDLFDRGPGTLRVYEFLKSIPKKRRVLIKGNHEQLYFNLLKKDYPQSYDFSNGTVDTFCQISKYEFGDADYFLSGCYHYFDGMDHDEGLREDWKKVKEAVLKSSVTKWLRSDEWKNYYELDKYIFVHSFIPIKLKDSAIKEFGQRAYQFENLDYFEYYKDWRCASNGDWDDATWGSPWEQYKRGFFKSEENIGKTLVCGHWHTSDFYKHLKNITTYDYQCAPIYYSKGLIGLDGGTMSSFYGYIHPQNILVIEDGICYDRYKTRLEESKAVPIIETFSK